MRTPLKLLARLTLCWTAAASASAQEWLDRAASSLACQSPHGWFRAQLSGLFDLEEYYYDQPPPGLLHGGGHDFLNPRLSFFLDTYFGKHFYSFVQARADRGFDPGAAPDGDARLDEYLLRYIAFDDERLNVQFGKFAAVVGQWTAREDSWDNPLITAPLPYENITIASDTIVPGSSAAFLARRNKPLSKSAWLPIIWGPSYATGGAILGRIEKFEYAAEVKNAALSSRPYAWDATDRGFDSPTVSGRVGARPNAAWDLGASASCGAYLSPGATGPFPRGKDFTGFDQITVGQDLSYAWRHWQFWAEVFEARFQTPNVGDADAVAYYFETKYKLTPHLFAAARWNQQLFGDVNGPAGPKPWGRDIWRIDAALGYRFNLHFQAKLQYSFDRETGGPIQQGEQLAAAQVTLKF